MHSTPFSRQWSKKLLFKSRSVANNYEKLLLRSTLDHVRNCQTLSLGNGNSDSIWTYRSFHSTLSSTSWSEIFLFKSRSVEKNCKKLQARHLLDHAPTCQTLPFENSHTNSVEIYRFLYTTLFPTQRSKKILLKTGNMQNNYEKLLLRSKLNHTRTCQTLSFVNDHSNWV